MSPELKAYLDFERTRPLPVATFRSLFLSLFRRKTTDEAEDQRLFMACSLAERKSLLERKTTEPGAVPVGFAA